MLINSVIISLIYNYLIKHGTLKIINIFTIVFFSAFFIIFTLTKIDPNSLLYLTILLILVSQLYVIRKIQN